MAQGDVQPTNYRARVALAVAVAAVLVGIWALGLGDLLTFERVKTHRDELAAVATAHPVAAPASYFAIYVVTAALSLPWATLLTLVGGFLFGLPGGVALTSLGSTIGATLAFLLSRTLLRDAVARRMGDRLERVDAGVRRDGAFYLLTLRLVPIFPFFVVNALLGLTPIRAWTYAWVSMLGMLPATVVIVNLGTRLGELDSAAGLLAPPLVASLAALGLLPLGARLIVRALRKRRAGAPPAEGAPADPDGASTT